MQIRGDMGNVSDLLGFLGVLYPQFQVDGFLAFSLIKAKAFKGPLDGVYTEFLEVCDLAAFSDVEFQALRKRNLEARENVYFGHGLREEELRGGRGQKTDVIGITAIPLDLDIFHPQAHKALNLPASVGEAVQLLDEFSLKPTLIVHTGFGLQAWWCLDKPFYFNPGKFKPAEDLTASLQTSIRASAQVYGWHVDETATVDRIWRLPGFFNWNGEIENPPVVKVLLDTEQRYTVEQIQQAASRIAVYARPTEALVATHNQSSALSSVPGGGEAASPAGGPDFEPLRKALRHLRVDANRQMISKVLAGESFAERGERDQALQKVCSIFSWLEPGRKLGEASVELLRPSLSVWASEPGATLTVEGELEKARDKFRRNLADWQEKRGNALARMRNVFKREEVPRNSAEVEQADPPDPLTPAEESELDQFRIVQYRTAFFVFDFTNGDYTSMRTKDELPLVVRDCFQDAPEDWEWYVNEEGVTKRTPVHEILRRYGTVAESVVLDLTLQKSYYDKATNTFYSKVAPQRTDIVPVYDPRIDEWLRSLAGDQSDKLLDWLATLTDLRKQTAGLYLSGPPSVGKSMLKEGVARIWKQSIATELGQVLKNFNDDLLSCPFVVADETLGTPAGLKGRDTSALLRMLVGSSSRTISRKHLPNVPLRGCIRLYLCANNERMLALGDEDMDLLDIEAVAGRFLHIKAQPAAAEYLQMIGGRSGTAGWVDEDKIAAHVLWLRDNRIVVPGGRFLVEGKQTSMHRQLLMQGPRNALVWEWLVKFVMNPDPVFDFYKTTRRDRSTYIVNGSVHVNADTIEKTWHKYMEERSRPPSMKWIATVLKSASIGIKSRPRRHVIAGDFIAEAADMLGIADVDEIQELLGQPMKPDLRLV